MRFKASSGDEKHSFPCAVMAPELHGTPWSVIETSLIRETQRHCQRPFELATSPAVSFARIESTVEVQDASINALIGTEGEGVFVAEVRDLQKHAAELFRRSPSSGENSLDRAYCRACTRRFGVVSHPSIHGRMINAREYDVTRTPSLHRVAPEEGAPRHVE
jgi:hypothetical protein